MIIPIAIISLVGLFLLFVAALGALRLPDFYTRSHAIGVTDTLGTLVLFIALALTFGLSLTTIKLFLIVMFIYIANPTVTHVLFRAALRCGLKPWTLESRREDGKS